MFDDDDDDDYNKRKICI